MKFTPSSFLSFLLLLVWSGLSFAAVIPDTTNINALDIDNDSAVALLTKRGCVPSREGPICTTPPTVAQLVVEVKAHKAVLKLDSLFYSDMGGGKAQAVAMAWHKANAEKANKRGGVTFAGIVDSKWFQDQGQALFTQPQGNDKVDEFQKNLSQAFAEVANGKVYFFTKAGNDGTNLSVDSAWGGWEYPALTRNPAVIEIIQVSMTGTQGTAHTIWTHGNPATAHAPRGSPRLA